VAQSSGEAEYYALVRAASESLGMQSLMRDMGWGAKIRLLVDSSAAKSIASRTGLGKLRHLEIKFLWLQEAVRRKKVVLSKVRGDVNPADVLTKPKSLDDMKQLLDFSCIDWCDSAHVNDVNHFCIDGRTFRPRGVLGNGYHIQGPITNGPMGLAPIFWEHLCVGVKASQLHRCVSDALMFGSRRIVLILLLLALSCQLKTIEYSIRVFRQSLQSSPKALGE